MSTLSKGQMEHDWLSICKNDNIYRSYHHCFPFDILVQPTKKNCSCEICCHLLIFWPTDKIKLSGEMMDIHLQPQSDRSKKY